MGARSISILFITLFTAISAFAQPATPPFRTYLASATTDQQKLDIYRNIFTYYKSSNNDSAAAYLEKGLEEFTAHNYLPGKGALLGMLSGNYSDQGKPDAAQKAADEALKIFTELKDEASTAKIHNSLGVIAGRRGQYNEAIKHFLLALQYFDHVSDTANLVNTYVKIGMANDMTGNKDQALSYFEKGLSLSLRLKESANTAHLLNNIGSIYASRHNYDKALKYLEKALNYSNNPRFIQARISPLGNIGNIYTEKNDPVKALQYLHEALQIAQATGQGEEVSKLMHSIGVAENLAMHTPTNTLQQSLDMAEKMGNRQLQADVLTDMARVADTNHNYKDEVSYIKRAQAIKDSLFNINKAKEIANLQSAYELKQSKIQLAALKVSEQNNRQKRDMLIAVAVILAVSLLALLFFFTRITRLNRKLVLHERELEKANAVKDRLFSIIGHDLRGPIGNIPVLLEVYRSKDTTEQEKNFILDSLEENSIASLDTLEKLLNWGKLQIKGQTLHPTTFNAGDTVNNKLRLFRVAADNKSIRIVNKVPAHVLVYTDENQFKFILRNLLSNAIKYTRANGQIEINAERHTDNEHLVFSVRDNGIGMDKERQQQIFEAGNESIPGTADEPGTSIGLMLCKEFVQQNGGEIWVESEKGKGSIFYFTVKSTGTFNNTPDKAGVELLHH